MGQHGHECEGQQWLFTTLISNHKCTINIGATISGVIAVGTG